MKSALAESKVQPLAPGLKPLVLPEIAVKIALGAQINRTASHMEISFDGQVLQMHESDFDIAARAAKRIRSAVPEKEMSISAILTMAGLAHKHVVEQIFLPGAVRVLYFTAMSKASAFYRCILPAMIMSKGQRVVAHVTTGGIAREALEYDVIVIQLGRDPGTLKFAQALQQMGKKVIFELDDAFDALAPWHPCYDTFKTPKAQAQVMAMIQMADAVTVTTEPLKQRYAQDAKRIEVLPNYLPLEDWPVAEPHETDEFRVLWAGSPSHFGDLQGVGEALSEVARSSKVKLIFMGREPVGLKGVPADQVIVLPWCEFEVYPIQLAEVKADVAIAPLADVEFNQYKSNLKLLEYGACGYPIIASDVGPYGETIRQFGGGLLCKNSTTDWVDALQQVYSENNLRRSLRQDAKALAQEFRAEYHSQQFEDLFRSLTE